MFNCMKKVFLILLVFFVFVSCKKFVVATVEITEKSTRTTRTADQIRTDYNLEKRLKNIVRDEFVGEIEYCGFNVIGNYVLSACIIKNQSAKMRLLSKINSIKEIVKIYDEIQVNPLLKKHSIRDYLIRKLIDMKFLFKGSIRSLNYEFAVINGIVYVIGISSYKGEIENVAKSIATIRGVKGVVSYTVSDY